MTYIKKDHRIIHIPWTFIAFYVKHQHKVTHSCEVQRNLCMILIFVYK